MPGIRDYDEEIRLQFTTESFIAFVYDIKSMKYRIEMRAKRKRQMTSISLNVAQLMFLKFTL